MLLFHCCGIYPQTSVRIAGLVHAHAHLLHAFVVAFLFCDSAFFFSLSFFHCVCACVCQCDTLCCVMLEGSMCLFDRAAGPARQSKDAIQTQTGSQRGKEIETWVVVVAAVVCADALCVCAHLCTLSELSVSLPQGAERL